MRYVPASREEERRLFAAVGQSGEDGLFAGIPGEVRLTRPLDIEGGMDEIALMRELSALAGKNTVYSDVFMGAGAYRHFIPAAVDAICSRGEFVTAYTPYQSEMSQGILQNIFEYQTMICELTGLDVSNASVYDGAAAAGEGCRMAVERGKTKALISGAANPQYIDVIGTYLEAGGVQCVVTAQAGGVTDMDGLGSLLDGETACVYIQSPNYYGLIEDVGLAAELAHSTGAKLVMGVNPIASALFKSPGELGADIATGDGQPLGLPTAFGGPHLGFMACKKELMRKLPGRIVGQTQDAEGRRAFVLTLQAREQHIRREKAGSNICSNQALCALRAAVYMSLMGSSGIAGVARKCYANAHYLMERLEMAGFAKVHRGEFFHEFLTSSPIEPHELQKLLDARGILGGLPVEDGNILWCATELNGKEQVDRLMDALMEVAG